MATIITNRATVNYRFGTQTASAVSNVTSTVLNGILSISKTSLSEQYRIGQEITYIVTLTNNSDSVIRNITIVDNLGTYMLNGNSFTPLTYIGPAQLFINGVFDSIITPTAGAMSVVFDVENIPVGGNAQIIYLARVNGFADGESGSAITNTATADNDCECSCDEPISDSHTLTAEDFADLRIVKSVCPNPVVCGGELRYVIDLYNYGNIPATDVILTDTFEPALSDLSLTVNGEAIPETDYSYVGGRLTLPSDEGSEITVPAAAFARNTVTGAIEIIPGHIQITVTGII